MLRPNRKVKTKLKRNLFSSVFDSFDEMHKALVDTKTVTGILDEMYSGLYYMEQVSDSRLYVAKVVQRTRSYGFAFREIDIFSWPVEDCIRHLILHRREDVYTLMKEYMDEMQVSLYITVFVVLCCCCCCML